MRSGKAIPTALVGLLTLGALACRESRRPEDIVRAQIQRALQAARDRDLGDVFADVASDFEGPRGLGRRETRRRVAGRLLRPGWMTVFAPRVGVAPPEAGVIRSTVELVVARGEPVERLEDVLPRQADHFWIRVQSRNNDGAWSFVRAEVDRGPLQPR